MKNISKVKELKELIQGFEKEGKLVGFVPTMGALHQGHLQLVKRAKKENDVVIVTIFVNPLQFNNSTDLEKYPNQIEEDIQLLEKENCDVLFKPTTEEVYNGYKVRDFDFGELENVMEGVNRPGHFNGVANIIYRLFDLIRPTKAYFGEKDFQQLAIVRNLQKQCFPKVEVVGCETVRSESGLALSSRNLRLNKEDLVKAASIHKAMKFCKENLDKYSPKEVIEKARKILSNDFIVEYFSIAEEVALQSINDWREAEKFRVFIAARISNVRLIDNLSLNH